MYVRTRKTQKTQRWRRRRRPLERRRRRSHGGCVRGERQWRRRRRMERRRRTVEGSAATAAALEANGDGCDSLQRRRQWVVTDGDGEGQKSRAENARRERGVCGVGNRDTWQLLIESYYTIRLHFLPPHHHVTNYGEGLLENIKSDHIIKNFKFL